jgi:hypothetical protein
MSPLLALLASAVAATALRTANASTDFDVIVYGATPAGIAAAIIAANGTGLRVALIEPSSRIGGMTVPGGIGLRDCNSLDSSFGNGSVASKWIKLNGEAYGVPYVLQVGGSGWGAGVGGRGGGARGCQDCPVAHACCCGSQVGQSLVFAAVGAGDGSMIAHAE